VTSGRGAPRPLRRTSAPAFASFSGVSVSRLLALVPSLLAVVACGSSHATTPPSGRSNGQACAQASDCASALCVSGRCAAALPGAACPSPGSVPFERGAQAGPDDAPTPPADPPCALPVRAVSPEFTGAVQELGAHAAGTALEFQVPQGTASFTLLAQEVDGSAADTVDFPIGGGDVVSAANPPGFTSVTAPGGALWFDWTAPTQADDSGALAEYAGFLAGEGQMTVPNTSRALDLVRSAGTVAPGSWRFTVTDLAHACGAAGCTAPQGSGTYDVKVLTRPGAPSATATLDLDFYFVSDDPARRDLTAEHALADPATDPVAFHFRRLVTQLGRTFSAAGLCLGRVRVHDVPGWARTEFHDLDIDTSGPCSPMSRLSTLAVEGSGIHLFLVDSLVTAGGTSGATVVGIDGSIPGPSAVPGTVGSGAAVVLADFQQEIVPGACQGGLRIDACGTDRVAYVAAHEAGHWLGLFHTSESSGTLFDPLADTARCECSKCAPPNQRDACAKGSVSLFSSSCASDPCGGAANLMFWLVDPHYARGELTPEQGEVMRYNPASRP
jgi:hypothetical protein